MIRRITMLVSAALLVLALSAPVALAAQDLPTGCEKIKGTVVCTTTDLPGNSDLNGQGNQPEATVIDETQGNTTNKNPEPQDLATNECTLGSPGLCKQAESGKF
jgi:hypothetical protein